jgi:hypothetical protein
MSIVSFSKACQRFACCTMLPALALSISLQLSPAYAQNEKLMDEKATTVFQGMSDYLAKAVTTSFRMKTYTDQMRKSGIRIKAVREGHVVMKRPNQINIEIVDENGAARTIWFDGSKLTVWARHLNEVKSIDFKGTTDALFDHVTDKYQLNPSPIADLLFSNVSKALGKSIISAEYLGLLTVDGVKCHHLSFESTGADWQIWIEADATPLPRRMTITYVTDERRPQYMAELDRWSIDGDVDQAKFTAGVPESAKEAQLLELE